MKKILKKWWFWLIVLVVLSLLPIFTRCGKIACIKVNFWLKFFGFVD